MEKQTLILFGSTGDLARQKILPGLLELWMEGHIKTGSVKLILVGRRDYDTDDFLNYLKNVEIHPFSKDLSMFEPKYVQVDFNAANGFAPLWEELKHDDSEHLTYYMSLSPSALNLTLERLQDKVSAQEMTAYDNKVIIEKPFGESTSDADRLQKQLADIFGDPHIYRNDHYLHKTAVEALQPLKSKSNILQEALKPELLDEVLLVASEQENIGTRVGYFDCIGMSIDWFQSHLLQLLAVLFASEKTDNFSFHKAELIKNLNIKPNSTCRGQYEGYQDLEDIEPNCETETFLKTELVANLPRYKDVNIKVITGKALAAKEVFFRFKLKRNHPELAEQFTLRIDPNQKAEESQLTDYAKLIWKVFNDDKEDFVTYSEVKEQWQTTEKLVGELSNCPLHIYEPGKDWQTVLEEVENS